MSERIIVREALRRREVFTKLEKWLELIAGVVKQLDPEAEVYLFGSVAEGRYNLSSDIDVLVVTEEEPPRVIAELVRRGVGDPFEIHVVRQRYVKAYAERSRLVRVR